MNEPKWLEIAEEEAAKNVAEIPGPQANPRIVEYDQHTTLKATSAEVPWCSAFANFCMDTAGIEGTDSAAAVSWMNWGIPLEKPVLGCVAVFTRPGGHHVGFYLKEAGDWIFALSGNASNKVRVGAYQRQRLMGYRWPANVPVPGLTPKAEEA